MTHPLTARLLRNRASFYQELLARIPSEKFRRELEGVVAGLPELKPPDENQTASILAASSPLLSALQLDEWLKKDGIGVARARRVISIETALDEACHLERLAILLCDALEEAGSQAVRGSKEVKAAHERAFHALSRLRDELEYHRMTLLDPSNRPEDSRLA